MLPSGRILVICLALALAGCSTAPRRQKSPHTWEGFQPLPTLTVKPEPILAPPPGTPVRPGLPPSLDPAAFPGNWVPLNRWGQANGWPAPRMVDDDAQPAYLLETPGGNLLVRINRRPANWAGMEVTLGYAPQLIDGQPYVHVQDLGKTIIPLLSPPPLLSAGPQPVVVLDPGHGGSDSGTLSRVGSYHEKHYTLDWALRLAPLLRNAGWEVILTRTRDQEVSLSNRVGIAESVRADLFLSLHFNSAAPNETESGIETYCLTPAGQPSNVTRGYEDDLQVRHVNNAYDFQNLHLAARVHRALVRATGANDRGLRRARFMGVLRNQQRPAILVEGGYLSNPAEARQIATAAYRQKLAEALAAALLGDAALAEATPPRLNGTAAGR